MVKKRSKETIVYAILNACKDGVNSTRLMYASGLNFAELKKYVELLISQGLIRGESRGKSTYYYLTEKGINALTLLEKYLDLKSKEEEIVGQLRKLITFL
ncbi:MAG: DUF4364 family protein [Sulfolobus sp.]